jgi:hypothetical protein
MIVFELKCRRGHQFEAWFNDAKSFDRLHKAGHVACALCGSSKVSKAPMAPRISTRKGKSEKPAETPVVTAAQPETTSAPTLNGSGRYANDPAAANAASLMKQLAELRGQIEKNCDYVGQDFPEEARKIHYGEAPKRNIYGEASDGEARELSEEGIEFARIPWSPRRDS